jgi:hypothetical protein
LLELRLRRLQILIRYVDLRFQRIKLWILEYRPPRAAKILVVRLSRLPVSYLFVGCRSLHRRLVVLWANHASGQLQRGYRYQNPPGSFV